MTWTLTEHIASHLTNPKLGDQRLPSLWPSEASAIIVNKWGEEQVVGACRRSTFFRYLISNYSFDKNKYASMQSLVKELQAIQIGPEKYMRFIWAAGELYEEYIIEQAKQSGVYLSSQIQITVPEFNMSGKLDLLVKNPYTGKAIAEEVKSIYGHNATKILGTPSKSKKALGTPRDKNLMQIALYDWHLQKRLGDNLEISRLLYGARDTGRYGEFNVHTYDDNGIIKIDYQGVSPWLDAKYTSPITITSVLNQFIYVNEHLSTGTIPPKDFELKYSDEKIATLYERDEIGSKADREQYEKIKERKTENIERIAAGQKPKVDLKPVVLGDWECSTCQWRRYCYGKETP